MFLSWGMLYISVSGPFQVTVINMDRGLSCSAHGDPHYTTFDGV